MTESSGASSLSRFPEPPTNRRRLRRVGVCEDISSLRRTLSTGRMRQSLGARCMRSNGYSFYRKEHIQLESNAFELAVGTLTRIVLMFVVKIEFVSLLYGKQATCIELSGAPFFILFLVIDLSADVGDRVIRMNVQWFLDLEPIAIAPLKRSVGPIQIGAVSVCEQKFKFQRIVRCCRQHHSIG